MTNHRHPQYAKARLLRAAGVFLVSVIVPAHADSPAVPADAVFVVSAVADTYVQDGPTAGSNYGSAPVLYVKNNSPVRFTYLRFDLSQVGGDPLSVRLRLFGNNTAASGTTYSGTDSVRMVDDVTWQESRVTWNERPAIGAAVASTAVTQSGRYYEWDVTQHVADKLRSGQKLVSLAIAMDAPPPNSQPNIYHSRENPSGNAPLLHVTARSGPAQHPDIWSEYEQDPDRNRFLPNVSYAGYHYGEDPLPQGSLEGALDVRSFGAQGDGVADDTEAIRAALAEARRRGGTTVWFPNGEYRISGVLFVNSSNTVLRGESREGVRLLFTSSLERAYGVSRSGTSSNYSWLGGMIWFAPESNNTYVSPGTPVTIREGWNTGAQITTIVSEHRRGDRIVTVADASRLAAGQFVFLRVDNTVDLSLLKYLTGEGEWAEGFDWSDTDAGSGPILPSAVRGINMPVEIASVDGNEVTLRQPLRIDLRRGWNARLLAMGNTIRESGIQDMTIVMLRDYAWEFAEHHNREPGWNGPWFNNAIHCWVQRVTVLDADTGLGVSASKNVTMSDFELGFTREDRRRFHHGTTCRGSSHDNLWTNFRITAQARHGINVESFSMGNVWSKGQMEYGTFDSHRRLPYENVRTEISVNNTGEPGGTGGPEMGSRFVHWNVHLSGGRRRAVSQPELMPSGALVGVRGVLTGSTVHPRFGDSQCLIDAVRGQAPDPPNLYEAQRELRLRNR